MNALRTLLLGATWCVLTREASLANVVLGLALGAVLVRVCGPRAGEGAAPAPRMRATAAAGRRVVLRPLVAAELAAFFLLELVLASLRVGALVLRPRLALAPMILSVPTDAQSEEELAVLSDLVTLTPGTLTLDVAPDGTTLVVHVLGADDPDAVRHAIRHELGGRVRRLFA